LTKGVVKLHLLLDHDGSLPSYAVITEGQKQEVRVARQMRFAPGTTLVFDRGYTDYAWFANLIQQGVYFVTRLTFLVCLCVETFTCKFVKYGYRIKLSRWSKGCGQQFASVINFRGEANVPCHFVVAC